MLLMGCFSAVLWATLNSFCSTQALPQLIRTSVNLYTWLLLAKQMLCNVLAHAQTLPRWWILKPIPFPGGRNVAANSVGLQMPWFQVHVGALSESMIYLPFSHLNLDFTLVTVWIVRIAQIASGFNEYSKVEKVAKESGKQIRTMTGKQIRSWETKESQPLEKGLELSLVCSSNCSLCVATSYCTVFFAAYI